MLYSNTCGSDDSMTFPLFVDEKLRPDVVSLVRRTSAYQMDFVFSGILLT